MLQEILALTKVLMVVPSLKNDPRSVDLALEIAGQELFNFPVKRYERNNVPSLLYSNQQWKDPQFKIILNTNLDVVEADKAHFRPQIKDGKLYGRGAYAMKAPAAAMILAFKHVAPHISYPLALQIVTDEESLGEDGTKYQIEEGVRANFVVTSASTPDFSFSNESKGLLWIKVTSKGKMAHTAYPWKGKNAIREMRHFLNTLEDTFPIPTNDHTWVTTVAVSNIKTTNTTFNNLPSDCEAWIDVRYISQDKDTIFRTIQNLLPEGFSIEIITQQNSEYTSKDNEYIKMLEKIYKKVTGKTPEIVKKNYIDEVVHFNNVGCPGIGFSPVGGDSHTDHEWVDIQSVLDYYCILKDFLLSLDSSSPQE